MSSEINGQDDGAALQTLQRILLAEDRERLQAVEQQLLEGAMDAEQLAELLPSAISTAAHRDEKLSQSLSATISESLHASIRNDPHALVSVLFPIMGPAIRRSIREAIAGLVQSLNKTLEQSLSWRALQWRWEAMRSGRPFAEIVLLRTLKYRVEHVFLIHRADGLLLQHVQLAHPARVEADLISGMLTAIQDFVRDSFGEDASAGLKQLEVGDRLIWIEPGPSATLAAVIIGHPPEQLRATFQEQLESIHSQYRRELQEFEGDGRVFQSAQPILERCLVSAQRETRRRPRARWVPWLAGALLAGVAVALGLWGTGAWRAKREKVRLARIVRQLDTPPSVQLAWHRGQLVANGTAPDEWLRSARERVLLLDDVATADWSGVKNRDQAWLDYLRGLAELPGVRVTHQEITEDRYVVAGLRDPLADDPQSLLGRFGIDPEHVQADWQFVRLWDGPFRVSRVQRLLDPPATIAWDGEGDVLRFRGSASHRWLQQAQQRAESVADVVQLDLSAVRDPEQEQLTALLVEIGEARIRFGRGSPRAHRDQVEMVQRLAGQMTDATTLAAEMQLPLRFTVVGTAWQDENGAGPPTALARQRAMAIGSYLVQRGVSRDAIVVTADPALPSPSADEVSSPASLIRTVGD